MEVKINKEIREYTEGIFLGLSLRQCFFSDGIHLVGESPTTGIYRQFVALKNPHFF